MLAGQDRRGKGAARLGVAGQAGELLMRDNLQHEANRWDSDDEPSTAAAIGLLSVLVGLVLALAYLTWSLF